jgi:uncharacterized membrane protein YfcA
LVHAKLAVFVALGAIALGFTAYWAVSARRHETGRAVPTPLQLAVGFVTNFFDTLGIGSFAPTTSIFKLRRMVPDEQIPGTLNVGHSLPTIAQAFVFIATVDVGMKTLTALIAASVLGAWLGASVVVRLPRRRIQVGMGIALLVAAALFAITNLGIVPGGGEARELPAARLALAAAANSVLGALMTLGIGLYAPCMIMVSLLGMNPLAAFPIMMGSCAFLMPVGSLHFVGTRRYSLPAALGLTLAGVPAVLIAAYLVKSLPLTAVRWGVVAVVLYTAVAMLRSAAAEAPATATPPTARP